MPGPGGGSRGGGFGGGSRGGGFSGGARGGGFSGGSRGPMHHGPTHHGPHHHHHHHRPIFFFGPRRHYYGGGGGCLGGTIAIVIILGIFALAFFGMLIDAFMGGGSGDPNGNIVYNENTFQRYANEEYFTAFSQTDDYENNILLVYTVYEGYDGYECIAWVGDNVSYHINAMFTGDAISRYISDYYEFQLSKGISMSVDALADRIDASRETVDTKYSKLINYSSLDMNKETVNKSLVAFAEKTGINIAVVVVNGADVFGVTESNDGVFAIIALIFIIAMILIVIASTKSKNKNNNKKDDSTDKTNPDAGQGKYDPNTGTWT